MDEFLPEALRYQVNGFGGAFREDDFVRVFGVDKLLNRLAGIFIGSGGLVAQVVHCPVDIAVLFFIIGNQPVDHLPGLLGGGCIVKIYQWFSMHQDVQDREIVPDM
jgi:hypothetical protein